MRHEPFTLPAGLVECSDGRARSPELAALAGYVENRGGVWRRPSPLENCEPRPVAASVEPLETEEQRNLCAWWHDSSVLAKMPALKLMMAIPNGGYRSMATGVALKAEGVKPGTPDLFFPCASRGFHGLWIELKRIKSGSLSADQVNMLHELRGAGYAAHWARGAEEAKAIITWYLGGWDALIFRPLPARVDETVAAMKHAAANARKNNFRKRR